MKTYKRKTVFSELDLSGKDAYIEVIAWANGEGFDVDVNSNKPERFQLSYTEYALLKKIIKKLDR